MTPDQQVGLVANLFTIATSLIVVAQLAVAFLKKAKVRAPAVRALVAAAFRKNALPTRAEALA